MVESMESAITKSQNLAMKGIFSPRMLAFVAYILDRKWTEPQISELSITSDGFLVTPGEFLGPVSELDRNLDLWIEEAEFTENEKRWFLKRKQRLITDWRR